MATTATELSDSMRTFVESQPVFFVATSPLSADGHVNLSPKGLDTLRVLGPRSLAYLDLTGSGNETAAHLAENGRVTFLWCAFEGPPRIVRVHGRGRAVQPADPEWSDLRARFPPLQGVRQIVVAEVVRVATSCGHGVPRMSARRAARPDARVGLPRGRGRAPRVPGAQEPHEHRRAAGARVRAPANAVTSGRDGLVAGVCSGPRACSPEESPMNGSALSRREVLGNTTFAAVAATAAVWLGGVARARTATAGEPAAAPAATDSALSTGTLVALPYEALPGLPLEGAARPPPREALRRGGEGPEGDRGPRVLGRGRHRPRGAPRARPDAVREGELGHPARALLPRDDREGAGSRGGPPRRDHEAVRLARPLARRPRAVRAERERLGHARRASDQRPPLPRRLRRARRRARSGSRVRCCSSTCTSTRTTWTTRTTRPPT